jgi:uncharacterized protein YbjT (DUF2867 family)
MSCSRATVFGGTGFLGRQIIRLLADDGADVRVAELEVNRDDDLRTLNIAKMRDAPDTQAGIATCCGR